MVKTNSIKNKLVAGAVAFTMAFGLFSVGSINVYAQEAGESSDSNSGYCETIAVPAGIQDGTYYGLQEVSNVMPGVVDDHHPFSYMIEVAVTVENEKIKDVKVTHIDQSTARELDVDYMNWAVSNLEAIKGIGTEGKKLETGVDSVSGATKSNLGIFRAVSDALDTKTTEPAFGAAELPENAVTAKDAYYPESGKAANIKLVFDDAVENPADFAIYNDGTADSQYGGIRFNQGEISNSKNGAVGTLADADYDYDQSTQTLKIYNTAHTGAGSYTINMYDEKGIYEDVDVTFCLNDTSVSTDDLTLENNTLKIAEGKSVTLDQLLEKVQSVEINGAEYVTYTSNHGIYQTRSPGTAVFGENGVVKLSAKVNPVVAITESDYNTTRGENTTAPLENKNESRYDVKLNIAGYPDVEGEIVNNGPAEVTIAAGDDDLTQNYDDENSGAFIPDIDATNGLYKIASSNTAVATVRAKNNAVTIKGSGTTILTVTSTDPTYIVSTAEAVLTVNAPEGSVSYQNGAVVTDIEKCGTKLVDYLKNAEIKITGTDGKEAAYTASDVIDTATGKINLEAAVKSGRDTVTVFPAYGEYSFTLSYDGFEDVKGTVSKVKKVQAITTDKTAYSKTFGNAAFSLNAKAEENAALTYKSSNTAVAAVSTAGKVTIKGAGTATITINAAETDNYKAASKQVTIKVAKASQSLKISSAAKTVKTTAVKKSAKTYTFTTSGKKTALKTVALTKTQKKAISKLTVSGNKVKVTVKKGAAKGTYQLKVYAIGTANYKQSAAKTITVKIK